MLVKNIVCITFEIASICESKVSAQKRFTVQQHIRCNKQLKSAERMKEKKITQLPLGQSARETSKTSVIYKDLLALICIQNKNHTYIRSGISVANS